MLDLPRSISPTASLLPGFSESLNTYRFEVSVVVATFSRPRDLSVTLTSLLTQSILPMEVLVVDDSPDSKTHEVVSALAPRFQSESIELKYIKNTRERGLTIARNIGASLSRGNVILFVDDDVALDKEYLNELLVVYRANRNAIGVQGLWSGNIRLTARFKILNALNIIFLLPCFENGKCRILRSFVPSYPINLNHTIACEWLSGCNQSYLRTVFNEFKFDENVRRYSYGEDIDFSYRLHKKYPDSLFITPNAVLVHKSSPSSRTPNKNLSYIRAIYWEYFFRKNMPQTNLNRLMFRWSSIGVMITSALASFIRWMAFSPSGSMCFHHVFQAQIICLKHREQLKRGDLRFVDHYIQY